MFRRNNIILSIQLSAISISLLFSSSSAYAETPQPQAKAPIIVDGDKVEYFQEQKKVEGTGNISIQYKGILLTCDKVTVDLETREAIAEGNVKVQQKGAYVTGEKISYNFDTQKGSVIQGELSAKPFYGKSKKVEKAGEKQVNMEKGYVTTCDLEHPHYRIEAKEVRVYLNDKVIAKNIVFYVGKVPIMYLPYYIMPLKDTKKTNITFIPGQSKDWGYFGLTGWKYHLNDNFHGDVLLDYRSKLGLAEGVNHYYTLKDIGNGAFKFYYTTENNWLTADPSSDSARTRYRYQLRHRWDIGKKTDTSVTIEFNKLSDPDIIKDYFYNEYEELQDPNNFNYISVVTNKPDYTTQLLIRKRFDKFYTVVERLPEFNIDIKNHRMTKKYPIYYRANASAVVLNEAFQSTVPSQKDLNVVRFDAYNQVSYAARLFKFWSVTPYVGTDQTYYSRNKWGDTNLLRGALIAGVDNSTKFYKIYNVNTNFMGLDINKLRHIITPSANYYYTHQPTISPDNLNQFDPLDALSAQNGVRLQLENKLQTKRREGEDMKSVDLATLIVSTDYMFRLKDNNLAYKSQKFKSVDFKLEVIPYPWLYTLSNMSINTKNCTLQTGSIDLVGNGGDKWSLGLGYRYENVETGVSNQITLSGMYKINEKWRTRVFEIFDFQKGSFQEQQYTICRDLHCWLAEFTYGVKNGTNDQMLWLVMRLKAFPETPLGFRRSYSRPQYGQTGN
jgi:LPS-assembly protein